MTVDGWMNGRVIMGWFGVTNKQVNHVLRNFGTMSFAFSSFVSRGLEHSMRSWFETDDSIAMYHRIVRDKLTPDFVCCWFVDSSDFWPALPKSTWSRGEIAKKKISLTIFYCTLFNWRLARISTLLYPVSLLTGCWDDQYRNPNANNRDHLVGQLTKHEWNGRDKIRRLKFSKFQEEKAPF